MPPVYSREIVYINDRLERDMAITQAEHNRMRSLGMHVVPYTIAHVGPQYAQMHSDFVTGERLDQLPSYQREREIGRIAAHFHRYYQDTKDRNFPYVISDITQPFQFMHGRTFADARPTTYLIDVEPSVIDVAEAMDDPEGSAALSLATELYQLRTWAQPYWDRQGLHDFPYAIPSEQELERLEAIDSNRY